MYVILDRALPHISDGLKPVHRRILYAMHETGNTPDKAYRKSARPVGDVMGKYHPHGDSAIYDALVRMAQQFSMGEVLIDGQGNFGSIDGDSAAAMRYTEVKLAPITNNILTDIEKDTVDFQDNYDGKDTEHTFIGKDTVCVTRAGSVEDESGMSIISAFQNSGSFMINTKNSMLTCNNKMTSALLFEKFNIPTPVSYTHLRAHET